MCCFFFHLTHRQIIVNRFDILTLVDLDIECLWENAIPIVYKTSIVIDKRRFVYNN
jgi:hypothetical protein